MPVEDLFHPITPKQGEVGAMGTVTMFGGAADTQDNGTTACGHSTIGTNEPYISLPIPVWQKYSLGCDQEVFAEANGVRVRCRLWDKGPTASLMRIADLAPKVMKMLGGDGLIVNCRITFTPGRKYTDPQY